MSRCRSWIAIVAILTIATALVAVALPERAEASSVKSRLRAAKLALRHSKDRLRTAEAALAAAEAAETALGTTTIDPSVTPSADPSASPSADPSATPTPDPSATPAVDPSTTPTPAATATAAACLSVEELRARVVKVRRAVRAWTRRVNRLSRQYRLQQDLARWERQHEWMKIIEVAAARYDVRAGGIYRMMMRESGGRRYAGSSTAFKGLFQYWTGTWKAGWNPWRGDSIYDGSSQIFATAYAIHKGLGPQMWTTTFAALY